MQQKRCPKHGCRGLMSISSWSGDRQIWVCQRDPAHVEYETRHL